MANRKFQIKVSAGSADVEARSGTPIYDEAANGVPPKGPYRARIKMIKGDTVGSGPNEGEPKFRMVIEIEEPEGTKKAKYNGYGIWYHMTIIDKNAGNINQFLNVLTDGKPKSTRDKVLKAFWGGQIMAGDDDLITKIGTFAIPEGGIPCGVNATTKPASGQYAAGLNVGDLFPISQAPEAVEADEDDDVEPEEDEDTDVEDESEEEDEIAAREEELEAMKIAERRSIANKLGIEKSVKGAALIEAILAEEFPEDEEVEDDDEDEEEPEDDEEEPDEDEDEDEEEDEEDGDELREELSGLTLAKLKARAKEEGFKLADYKGLDKDGLIDLIVGEDEEPEDEEDEEDEEAEEEPEPVKKTTRRPAAKKGTAAKAPARRSGKRSGDRPPF